MNYEGSQSVCILPASNGDIQAINAGSPNVHTNRDIQAINAGSPNVHTNRDIQAINAGSPNVHIHLQTVQIVDGRKEK